MLITLDNGWYCYNNGRKWRLKPPYYLCEVDTENNIPSYDKYSNIISKIRRIDRKSVV